MVVPDKDVPILHCQRVHIRMKVENFIENLFGVRLSLIVRQVVREKYARAIFKYR
jgi:hypothetical protein